MRLGKAEGYILSTPRILFGETVAQAFQDLTEVMTNATAAAASRPDTITNIFNSLKNIEGAAANLKGPLFELITGHLIYKKEGFSIDIGEKVTDENGNAAEIDVLGVLGKHSVHVVECKARNANSLIGVTEINKWLNDRIPLIHKSLKGERRFAGSKFTFEYWTTSDYTTDAKALLKKHNAKKYKIIWRNGTDVLQYSKDAQATAITQALKDHFMNHPLAKAIKPPKQENKGFNPTAIGSDFLNGK